MLDWMIILWTWFTLMMIVGYTPIVIARVATGIIRGQHISFNNIEYFGFVVSVTYWVVRYMGVI